MRSMKSRRVRDLQQIRDLEKRGDRNEETTELTGDTRLWADNGSDFGDAEYRGSDSPCISGCIFSAAGISGIYPGDHTAESFVRILCKFYHCICGHGGECHHGTDPCVGAGAV